MRHGFSVANSEKRFAGHSDYPLTELGMEQAKKCAEALENVKIDAIYASDLKRAYQTAMPVAESHDLEITPCRGLREIYAGLWERKLFDELCVEFADDYTAWRTDIGRVRCTGGESTAELSERIIGTLKDIAAENEGKTVCIATHATPIRAVCTAAAGLDPSEMARIPWVTNASLNIFDFNGEDFIAVSVDNTDHLGDLRTRFPSNV